ncbi:hemocyte protein-glutamine gamma-glutamyltransferase-like isoform X1, partial [Leptotrombidium deliense]
AINLKKVELYTQFNAEEHKTSYFESVQEKGDLIIRRGKAFYISLVLNQNYDFNAQQFWLQFIFGSKPKIEDKSLGNLKIRANTEFMKQLTDWDINMYNGNGSALNVQVFIPASVPIGEWKIRFIIIENGQRKIYEIKNDVYVLFNPWVKEDDVYMPNEAALEEYVLNDVGKVYLGTSNSRDSREWLYGQYKLSVLPAIMYLINLAPLEPVHRSNAMQLTSVLSALVSKSL